MSIYADSSFFVSLYLNDRHAEEAGLRVAKRPSLWLTPLHWVEWTHAIAQHVFRGIISSAQAQQFYSAFELDRERKTWLEVEMPEMAFETAMQLGKQHGPHLGQRSLDALHVASALELGAERFWTFDERQAKLAKAVGLRT